MDTTSGKLEFHSETGTEGGYYTLQNAEHITYEVSNWGIFNNGHVYDPDDVFRRGRVRGSYKRDGTPFESSKPGDISLLDITWEDEKTDTARPSNTVLIEQWGYDGLLMLNNGDNLNIFEKGIGSTALWEGTVELIEQNPYAKGSFAPSNMASHHIPQNTGPVSPEQWTQWFFERRWATLKRKTEDPIGLRRQKK